AVLGAGIAMLGVSVDTLLRIVIFPTGGPIIAYYTLFGRPIIYFGSQVIFVVLIIFAILRYRLWNVDLVINRGLVLAGVTCILAIVFVTGFFALQYAFSAVLGGQQTTAAVAVSAAVIAGLFNPTRYRV